MTSRRELLEDATDLVDGARNITYGDPNADFSRTAALWNIYLDGVRDRKWHTQTALVGDEIYTLSEEEVDDMAREVYSNIISPSDVGVLMILLKISRITWSPLVRDHYLDIAGYAACAYDCASTDVDAILEDLAPIVGNTDYYDELLARFKATS